MFMYQDAFDRKDDERAYGTPECALRRTSGGELAAISSYVLIPRVEDHAAEPRSALDCGVGMHKFQKKNKLLVLVYGGTQLPLSQNFSPVPPDSPAPKYFRHSAPL